MTVAELVRQPGAWLTSTTAPAIAISSRIRLARNVAGSAFPGWAGETEAVRLAERLDSVLTDLPELNPAERLEMSQLSGLEKEILKERHLISNEFAQKGRGSRLLLRADEGVSVMVNEEDHLRLQAMCAGMNLTGLWETVNAMDDRISAQIPYAFDDEYGYLTACPTNVGTGVRASVMLHLPGLRLANEIEAAVRGLGRIGLAVRGLLGEGTEASGNMYQISNQGTLGETEKEIVDRLTGLVNELIVLERNARQRLMERSPLAVRDQVSRALGTLTHAWIMSSREVLDLMSAVRLGIEVGLLEQIGLGEVNRLMLLTQPGHLQNNYGAVGAEERDRLRAELLRERMRMAVLKPV